MRHGIAPLARPGTDSRTRVGTVRRCTPMADHAEVTDAIVRWFDGAARILPWRAPDVGAWGVLVSEVMLQQTPVARVLPVYEAWLRRWPTPQSLAAEPAGEAVRMWGRLGYPRRALRLHACAVAICDRHDGEVPVGLADLLALPGVGEYTARAVAAFAFGLRAPVVDTNVRRVLARAITGQGEAGPPATVRDLETAERLLPLDPVRAVRLSAALMELGALVCTARSPACGTCPIVDRCAWVLAGRPAYTGRVAATQRFAGTDRQVRGLLLDVLRGVDAPVGKSALDLVWAEPVQRERALDSLVADGLIDPLPDGRYALPG